MSDLNLKPFEEAALSAMNAAVEEFVAKPPASALGFPFSYGLGGDTKAPIQRAFLSALSNAAQGMAQEFIAADPRFREKVASVYAEACARVFETNREKTVTRIADAVETALTRIDDEC